MSSFALVNFFHFFGIVMTPAKTYHVKLAAPAKLWAFAWRIASLGLSLGMLIATIFDQPLLVLTMALLGTALGWAALDAIERQPPVKASKPKADHWAVQRHQLEAELKAANQLVAQYQLQLQTQAIHAVTPAQDAWRSDTARAATAPAQLTSILGETEEATGVEHTLKSHFLSTLSHEIRTPMNGLVGMTQLVLQTDLTPQQRKQISLAHESALHLMNVINGVLDYSKLQAGHLGLELRPCHPIDLLHQTLRGFYPQAHAKGISLGYEDIVADTPPVLLDPLRLRQVMSNLISNAIKFTNKGYVHTSLRLTPTAQASTWLMQFTVQDSGVGFQASKAEHLFQPFTQGRHHNPALSGMGLGLAITRELVQLMGGHMQIESAPSQGATFSLTLPCSQASEAIPMQSPEPLSPVQSPLHILVVEDHPINMQLLCMMLDQMGHTYAQAHNGQEALSLFTQHSFDLVLLDVMMPVMDGMAALRRMRESRGASHPQTPVIMVTAYALNFDRERFLDAGANGYVSKPISQRALNEEVNRLVRPKTLVAA